MAEININYLMEWSCVEDSYAHVSNVLARGWLIERARTKRLRKQLENARDHADFWRHEALLRLDDDPAEVYGDDLPHLWEADQAAKGGE